MKAEYLSEAGIFDAEIADCFVKYSEPLGRYLHVVEFRTEGSPTLWAVVDRCSPDQMPILLPGEKLLLEVIERKTRHGSFFQHRWNRRVTAPSKGGDT